MSADFTYCFSSSFDRTVREMVDDYDTRLKLFKMINKELVDYASTTCQECEYRKRCES